MVNDEILIIGYLFCDKNQRMVMVVALPLNNVIPPKAIWAHLLSLVTFIMSVGVLGVFRMWINHNYFQFFACCKQLSMPSNFSI